MDLDTIPEPARNIPVACEADICVVGGSCTGVFAAVRAARLGARVVVIEHNGFFGGVATAGLVNIWHTLNDTAGKKQIIGGLTAEVLERLGKRNAVLHRKSLKEAENHAYILNTEELKLELDALVCEAKVRPFLHAGFVAPIMREGRIEAVVIEDKTGRRAVKARFFVDATGDGDVVHRAGLPTYTAADPQPPTACALFEGLGRLKELDRDFNLAAEVFNPRHPEALKNGFLWSSKVPGSADLTMVAGTRVPNADCADADQLTRAEIEARRQVRAMLDLLRKHVKGGEAVFLRGLPAYLGIRETRHAACLHTLTEDELLTGKRFADAVANGTYPVDLHHNDKPGITFRYLDGRETYVAPGKPPVQIHGRSEGKDRPTFYQIPFQSLVPREARNLLAAGRLLDADGGAYGAVRVMVNCNQTGEAAGTACVLALRAQLDVKDVPTDLLRRTLSEGGSIIF